MVYLTQSPQQPEYLQYNGSHGEAEVVRYWLSHFGLERPWMDAISAICLRNTCTIQSRHRHPFSDPFPRLTISLAQKGFPEFLSQKVNIKKISDQIRVCVLCRWNSNSSFKLVQSGARVEIVNFPIPANCELNGFRNSKCIEYHAFGRSAGRNVVSVGWDSIDDEPSGFRSWFA